MNVYLRKKYTNNQNLSDSAVMAYVALKMIDRKDQDEYFVSMNMLYFCLCGNVDKKNRYFIESLKAGVNELINNGIISLIEPVGNKEYILDLKEIYLDVKKASDTKDYFTVVSDDEIHKIMNSDTKDCLKMCRYFIYLVGTFVKLKKNSSKADNEFLAKHDDGQSFELKTEGIGYMSIDPMAENSGISSRAIKNYNSLLEKLELIYIYRSDEIIRDSDGKITGFSNTYGRFCDKDKIIKAGKQHEYEYGSKHKTERKKANKAHGDMVRSYSAKFNAFRKGKEYSYDVLKEIYLSLYDYNEFYVEKYKSDWHTKDLSIFGEYDFYVGNGTEKENTEDQESKPEAWGEDNPIK